MLVWYWLLNLQASPGIRELKETFIPVWSSYWVQDWLLAAVRQVYVYTYIDGIEASIKLARGWYYLNSLPDSYWYKTDIASAHTILVGYLLPVLIPGVGLYITDWAGKFYNTFKFYFWKMKPQQKIKLELPFYVLDMYFWKKIYFDKGLNMKILGPWSSLWLFNSILWTYTEGTLLPPGTYLSRQ